MEGVCPFGYIIFMKAFDAKEVKNQVVRWIRDWFEINGKGCNAVIGISGGKDSMLLAKLISVCFSDRPVIVCPRIPDVARKLGNKVRFLLPYPEKLIHCGFERCPPDGQDREFL